MKRTLCLVLLALLASCAHPPLPNRPLPGLEPKSSYLIWVDVAPTNGSSMVAQALEKTINAVNWTGYNRPDGLRLFVTWAPSQKDGETKWSHTLLVKVHTIFSRNESFSFTVKVYEDEVGGHQVDAINAAIAQILKRLRPEMVLRRCSFYRVYFSILPDQNNDLSTSIISGRSTH